MNCRVMGIVNVTPDSFSDGGKFFAPEEALRRARNLIADGAEVIDLGGESTRPGATPIGWEEEWARLEPVLKLLFQGSVPSRHLGFVPISIDTYHPETAERAIAAGATIINCVAPESVPAMAEIITQKDIELVIPWRIGGGFAGSVPNYLGSVPRERLYLDPLIGFGTTREEDVELLRSIPELAKLGRVLVGASRKRIIKKLTGEKTPGKDIAGNVALALYAAVHGASMVRVHDVRETVQAFKVWNSLP